MDVRDLGEKIALNSSGAVLIAMVSQRNVFKNAFKQFQLLGHKCV